METKTKIIMDTTTNNSVYNKTRKDYLEATGKIRCSWCSYHNGDNEDRKYYGVLVEWSMIPKIIGLRYPNWKLVSKNRKQWMKKPLIKKKRQYRFTKDYYTFEF